MGAPSRNHYVVAVPQELPAGVVLACRDLDANQRFFATLGFRLDRVFPADAPRQVELSAFGLTVCLRRSERDGGGHLRLPADERRTLQAPNGACVELGRPLHPQAITKTTPTFRIWRAHDLGGFHDGRAGMAYRDLLPDRLGGAVIVSHIRVARGGPVPDYVHFHHVQAQVLYVIAGWVRVVYQDQGPPFVLHVGDCVVQPPQLRHRVLECSDGFEVIEVASPAEHVTCVDHEMTLPTSTRHADRTFSGQRCHHHVASASPTRAAADAGLVERDCGIADATNGRVGVRVLRRDASTAPSRIATAASLRLWLPQTGTLTVNGEALGRGDTCVLPALQHATVTAASADLELLEFSLRLDANEP